MTDILVAGLLESKAFSLFSFVFGVGLAIQAERAELRGIGATHFLARRLLILLALGLFHMVAIWNGDILVLHSVCGLLVLPLRRLPPRVLLFAGAAMFVLPVLLTCRYLFPVRHT